MRRTLVALLAITAALAALLALGSAAAIATSSGANSGVMLAHTAKHHKAKTHHRGRHHHRRHRRRRHRHKHHRRHHAKRASTARRSASPASLDCSYTNLIPTSEDLAQIRSATVCLVNRERVTHGLQPLSVNGKLNRAAQGHSEDMVAEDYFSHYGPSGDSPASRMRAAGYIYSSNIGYEVGENIAWGTLGLSTPQSIVDAWMRSPGHRANILDPHYRETGMGVVAALPRSDGAGQPGAMYTQDFGVIITG
jgi:uncharacterized protein YkwD